MKQVLSVLQAASGVAFLLLGVATVAVYLRRRDRSLGYLALAIVLLTAVILASAIPELSLLAFMGCGYSLFRFRSSLIPLGPRWHRAVIAAMVVGYVGFVAARILVATKVVPSGTDAAAAILVIVVWSALVIEPIVRFWLVARKLPAVQAWRLRSLSLGFAGFVAIILFAIGAGAFTSNPAVQILIQVVVLAMIPLLYVSFAPPAWLRRQWRTTEEAGLSRLMQELLVLESGQSEVLLGRGLNAATRLVGASSAVVIDSSNMPKASDGLEPAEVSSLQLASEPIPPGRGTIVMGGREMPSLTVPFAMANAQGDRVILIAGPFTPGFGKHEESRATQFVTALGTALDRLQLIDRLEATNVQLHEVNHALKEANQHKSAFLANMSHELRTPLNSILGFSELLQFDATGQFDDTTKGRFIDQINTSGQHLLQLINDILDLSKVEAGQMELDLQEVTVAETIETALATVRPLAQAKHITLDAKPGTDLVVHADAAKVKQMLLNLLSNAIKFTPEGGAVTVRAEKVDPYMTIAVTDTGVGIEPKDLERLFVEFQQLGGPGGRHGGTGLGLALTRRFAEMHGGHVLVESVVGQGSTFTIQLPLEAKVAKARSVHPPFHSADPDRPLVLIVDDNPEAAEILARYLDSGGFRSKVARNGNDALSMARNLEPVAITLDILLPQLDGWEVLTRLKADPTTSSIPVVVISVVDNPALGRALGALDYFVKPVDGQALLSRLSRYNFTSKVKAAPVRVLVVDDEPVNLDLLTSLLQPAGFTVSTAGGGQEGIDSARAHQPDLMLLDLMMPDVNGFDVVEALRADESTRAIPIMVLTAKILTSDDKKQLNGQVAGVFERNSLAGAELVGWLRGLISTRTSA